MEIDLPRVNAEIKALFAEYEHALVTNNVEKLDAFFWPDARAIRYGGNENLYGYEEIAAFRAARSAAGLERTLDRTVVTAFGPDMATVSTLFRRTNAPGKIGRQMQTWVRFDSGWKIVCAHVSVIEEPESSAGPAE
ncbi:MAG: oxalurate catabolism protein HpxZ [Alphaproteobacteria bacterium]|nr:oxalurate catabolism protein HpxZ [Alphaproteobacteria bacterium]